MDVNQERSDVMKDVMKRIEDVMAIVDRYEISRPGSMAFTKLEEAILWIQVLVSNVSLKEVQVVAEA